MTTDPKVYTASKLHHAPMWRLLNGFKGILITSRWISMETFDDDEHSLEQKRQGWIIDEDDVRRSDYILVFAAEGELLRGALVEAGMGIALGKKLVLCGKSESFGTWQFHPQVMWRGEELFETFAWIVDDWAGKHTRHG